jgi:signal transduction histidine kinase
MYVALLASAFVCLTVAAIAFRLWSRAGGLPVERVQSAGNAIAESVPGLHVPGVRPRLAQIAAEFGVDIVMGDALGPRVGVPSVRAFPPPARLDPGLRHERGGPTFVVELDDGGWAAVRAQGPYRRLRVHPFFATLLVLAVVMALGSYPVARRVARRLESLAAGVETWGAGRLDHRVNAEGHDEIGRLATTFNQAAERVSCLLAQQKQMLANVSHELRSPLARVRMGLELVAEEPDAARRVARVGEIHRDIVELDGLIEELLVFARADARVPSRPLVEVDLAALCREEAARVGARCDGPEAGEGADGAAATRMLGDEPLLRHMLRNLLENAVHHGGGLEVRIVLGPADATDTLTVRVEDAGPGIPEAERERVFAPFYRASGGDGSGQGQGRGHGHGVGLALVRQVARYHGGEVRYLPRPGGGSAFEVRLPRRGPIPTPSHPLAPRELADG